MSSITVRDVRKTYRPHGVEALRGVEFSLPSKQFLSIVGPSGCGKSTLLRCIAGLEQIDSGGVGFDDLEVSGLPAHQREAVMVFQETLLFPHLSIFENVAFGLRVRKHSQQSIERRVREVLQQVQLVHLAQKRPHQISGGEQQRIALARALVILPKILLLDEPLANLDRHLWRDMAYLIRELHNRHQITTILVTHNQEEALLLGDRIAVMFNGRIAQIGRGVDLYRRPKTLEIARFFDAHNIHPATKRGGGVVTEFGELTIDRDSPYRDCPDGRVMMVIRPEDIVHVAVSGAAARRARRDDAAPASAASPSDGAPARPPDAAAADGASAAGAASEDMRAVGNKLQGGVVSSRFTGTQWRTRVRTGALEWETLGRERHEPQARTVIHLSAKSIMLFES